MGSLEPLYANLETSFDGVVGLELGFGERGRQMLEGGDRARASISAELRFGEESAVVAWSDWSF